MFNIPSFYCPTIILIVGAGTRNAGMFLTSSNSPTKVKYSIPLSYKSNDHSTNIFRSYGPSRSWILYQHVNCFLSLFWQVLRHHPCSSGSLLWKLFLSLCNNLTRSNTVTTIPSVPLKQFHHCTQYTLSLPDQGSSITIHVTSQSDGTAR
jgi:hypothetical protein